MSKCKDCKYFHIRCEYKNPYEWGEAVCKKHNLITDFRSKKKFETLSCIEDDTQKGVKKMIKVVCMIIILTCNLAILATMLRR